ncbi:hypothetical protein BsWGS_08045 [Bradybaena similaris]
MVSLWYLLTVVGLVLSASVAVLGVECNTKNEGRIVERGCWGYVRCVNGEPKVTSCPDGSSFDVSTKQCTDQVGNAKGCGLCDGKPDGFYADLLEDCEVFFSCNAGVASDEQKCPKYMKYDEKGGKCNMPQLFGGPCGSLDG